jgi:hypothetical protein
MKEPKRMEELSKDPELGRHSMKSDGKARAQNVALLNRKAEPRIPEVFQKFILIQFKSLGFCGEDQLTVLNNIFHKPNVESLTTAQGALLLRDLSTLVRFKQMGLKSGS